MPIVETNYKGMRGHLDPTALTPEQLGRAWIAGRRTYQVHTMHTQQWAVTYVPTQRNVAEVIEWIKTGNEGTHTVLAWHDCPGEITTRAQAVSTWKTKDAKPHMPKPQPAQSEGVPF
jgi:hypothetical protein